MAQLALTAARPEEILLPAKPWFVLFTLLAGLAANMLPLSGMALLLRPDCLALILLFWCIECCVFRSGSRPRRSRCCCCCARLSWRWYASSAARRCRAGVMR